MFEDESKMVVTFYSTLPYVSKLQDYWLDEAKANNFNAHIFQYCTLLGIRNNLPDKIEIDLMRDALLEDFPNLNENCITQAIKMNLKGKLDQVYNAFNSFNVKFLYEILNAYLKKLQEAHKIAMKIKSQFDNDEDLTDENKEILLKVSSIQVFKNRKENNLHDLEFLSYPIYDYLVKIGKINLKILPKEHRDKLMIEAENHYIYQHSKSNNNIFLNQIELLQKAEDKKIEIKNIAKKMAVRDYFQVIDTLEL